MATTKKVLADCFASTLALHGLLTRIAELDGAQTPATSMNATSDALRELDHLEKMLYPLFSRYSYATFKAAQRRAGKAGA